MELVEKRVAGEDNQISLPLIQFQSYLNIFPSKLTKVSIRSYDCFEPFILSWSILNSLASVLCSSDQTCHSASN